jgi:hypothetical protein
MILEESFKSPMAGPALGCGDVLTGPAIALQRLEYPQVAQSVLVLTLALNQGKGAIDWSSGHFREPGRVRCA